VFSQQAGQYDAAERAARATDYRMIQNIQIKNFKCFANEHLDKLSRINLVVGRNATGKTALLEAIFIASGGSPEIAMRFRHFRGMGQKIAGSVATLPRIWHDLASGFRLSDGVFIQMTGTADDSRSLAIEPSGESVSRTLPFTEGLDSESLSPAVNFTWTDAHGRSHTTRPRFGPQGITFEEGPPSNVRAAFFPANYSLDPEEASHRLSDLRKSGESPFLIETLKTVFQDVIDVSVETNVGSWLPHVSIKGIKQMIPVAQYSQGTARFVAYIAGIAAFPRGVILIDEIENGLYYKTLEQAWRALHRFATRYETQLFVSTHSGECLEALKELASKHQSDFSLIRANREGDERWLDCFSGDRLAGALEQGFELR
jgi:AAA domain-containing protein/putative AbiEii toxin of type IV toxin-antitoxin system